MNPITKQRIKIFKNNKKSFYALVIFGISFLAALFADFIANDKPLIICYDKKIYFPIVKYYPETTFGGTMDTEANYLDNYVQDLIKQKGWMIWPIIKFGIHTVDYNSQKNCPSPPDKKNWLGTDDQGRDLLTRVIYSFRTSIFFGLLLTIFSVIFGVLIGGLQGYFGGKFDLIFQRLTEIWTGLPFLYLLIILSSMVEPGFYWLLMITVLFSWMGLAAIVRVEFFRARCMDYVKAAEAIGVSNTKIVLRHILPNAAVATITYVPFILNHSIATLTSLDFLGFGLPPGSPSLGELLTQAKNNIQCPWIGITAFIVITFTLSSLVFIGEGVRDAFDPKTLKR